VVGFDDSELHKPDAEPLFVAMERMLLDDAEDVVFVGDSPADIWAARNAGAVSVAALWGTLDRELLLDAMTDHVAESPDEVLRVIAGAGATP
jgi:pyrophosphatase PpaX